MSRSITGVDAKDFSQMKKTEEADLKSNFNIQTHKTWLLPLFGPFHTFYNYFFLFHKVATALYLPFAIAFIEYPQGFDVFVDSYFDAVFFLEIIAFFNRSFYDS